MLGQEYTEMLDVIDEDGNPTGKQVERIVAHRQGILHKTTHTWVFTREKDTWYVLLQKRSARKPSFPGCYDISTAGHIPAGMQPLASAIREAKEEIGLECREKDFLFCGARRLTWNAVFADGPFHDEQISEVYALQTSQKDFSFEDGEVEGVLWQPLPEVLEDIQKGRIQHCIIWQELFYAWQCLMEEKALYIHPQKLQELFPYLEAESVQTPEAAIESLRQKGLFVGKKGRN